MDRIEINGVWYVKEDTLKKKHIDIDPTHFDGYVVEDDDFCFEATRIFRDDGTPYENCVSIEYTDKRFPDRKVDHWDNTLWMKGILDNNPGSHEELPDMGLEGVRFFQAFLQYLTDKKWL